MTKREFIDALNARTGGLPQAERERLAAYFAEIIDDRMEDGVPEAEAVAALGSLDELIRELAPGEGALAPQAPEGETVEALRSLSVSVRHADVTLRRAALGNGAAAQIRFSNPERFAWRMNGDALEITENAEEPKRGLFGLLELGTRNLETVTVTLASGLEGAVNCSSAAGDLIADGLESAGPMDLSSKSGDVKLRGCACAGGLRMRSASGDVDAREVRCGEMALSTVSGDVEIDRGQTGSASVRSVSGDVRIDELTCDDRLTVETASGDIDLARCVAPAIQLNAVSGDIEARVPNRAGKCSFNADTRSGRIRLPREWTPTDSETECRVGARTVSGDITITIVE